MKKPAQADSAAPFVPASHDLQELSQASQGCQGCELYREGTQTVFGEGRRSARFVLIGEQPGDEEDRTGHPFVGAAGRLLDQALAEAGIDRADCYVTNAVKHFHWEPKGKRRLHKKPTVRHVVACHPWLEAEIAALKPEAIVCLGATAARAVFSRPVTIVSHRGQFHVSPLGPRTLVTVHPSAILRTPDREARHAALAGLVADLKRLREE